MRSSSSEQSEKKSLSFLLWIFPLLCFTSLLLKQQTVLLLYAFIISPLLMLLVFF